MMRITGRGLFTVSEFTITWQKVQQTSNQSKFLHDQQLTFNNF